MVKSIWRCLMLCVCVLAASAVSVQADSLPQNQISIYAKTGVNVDENLSNTSALEIKLSPLAGERVASVCFITDNGKCRGNLFSNGEDLDGGNEEKYEDDPVAKCHSLGFNLTSCSAGRSPRDFCPYDNRYFSRCECTETCPSGYQAKKCGSGMLTKDVMTPNCQTCYRCVQCSNECPKGYSLEKGVCNQTSSYKTECGDACYKEVENICATGTLEAPEETNGMKNKIVGYTKCNKPCFQSYNDNCPTGYTKTKPGSGKCYDSATTDYGSACYKEKSCCADSYKYTCTGMNEQPGASVCGGKYNSCKCIDGYVWNSTLGKCTCSGTEWCSLPQNCKDLGYRMNVTCVGKFLKCPFDSNYVFCVDDLSSSCAVKPTCASGEVLVEDGKDGQGNICYKCEKVTTTCKAEYYPNYKLYYPDYEPCAIAKDGNRYLKPTYSVTCTCSNGKVKKSEVSWREEVWIAGEYGWEHSESTCKYHMGDTYYGEMACNDCTPEKACK